MAQRLMALGRGRTTWRLRAIVGILFAAPASIVGLLPQWQRRANAHHYLATLSDHVVRDVGLDRPGVRRRGD